MVEIITGDGEENVERTDRKFEPFAIAHEIQNVVVEEEPEEAVFRERGIGSVKMVKLGGDRYKVTVHFHESAVSNTFKFDPMPSARAGGTAYQGTSLTKMGGDIGELAQIMRDKFDMRRLEFAELDAASMGHENLTDYEFQYEGFVSIRDIKQAQF